MEKRVILPLWGDAGPMTEIENALDDLEPSWSDFAYAIRPKSMGRVSRRIPGRPTIRAQSLGQVQAILNGYREQFEAGDRAAAFSAMTTCAEENVPMPYWLAAAVLDIGTAVRAQPARGQQPKSLHDLFGLSKLLPTTKTRGSKVRRDLQLRAEIWAATHTLMRDRKLSVDAAIKLAREKLNFPYAQRTARQMFDTQESIQTRYLNIVKGRTVHKVK